jgi:hypothetical protein
VNCCEITIDLTHSLETHRPWKVEQLGNGYFLSRWMKPALIPPMGCREPTNEKKMLLTYGVNPEK